MKKLLTAVSATLIIATSAAQVADSLVGKILKFSVKELFTEHVFSEVWKSSKLYNMEPGGYSAYYSARSGVYENIGIKYGDWETYLQARTIVVARIKTHFFDGENLKDTYLAIRPRFKEEFSKLSDKEKGGLRQSLKDTKTCFEMMLKSEYQKKYDSWLETLSNERDDNRRLAENWLVNNLSAEDVVERIRNGELNKIPDPWDIEQDTFKIYPDKDIAKFAGRRFKDGGEKLISKYVEVIDLAIADAK